MKREDLRIGQRIILTEEVETLDNIDKNRHLKAGMRGTIINKDYRFKDGCIVLIEFEDYINGHDGNKRGDVRGKNGHCWWLYKEDLTQIAKVCKRKNNY